MSEIQCSLCIGMLPKASKEQHINLKELYCFLVSLRHFGKTWKRAGIERILAFSDNTPTVGCLNKLRSPSNGMN